MVSYTAPPRYETNDDDYADANDEPEDGFALSLIVPITSRFQPTGPMTSALFYFGFWILDFGLRFHAR